MTRSYKTEQEQFWAGEFGNTYVDRNSDPHSIAYRTALFAKILSRTKCVNDVLELGANIGVNLRAIRNVRPNCSFSAIEINAKAVEELKTLSSTQVFKGSIFDFSVDDLGKHDLTLTSGVLIHIEPSFLSEVYDRLYICSNTYILLIEYYNPTPVEVTYRGYSRRLFKRDFAGEMLERFVDLELVDYGFQYHRDYNFPADDATWFLMRKKEA